MNIKQSYIINTYFLLTDLMIINLFMTYFKEYNITSFLYLNILWLLLSTVTKIYSIYSHTKSLDIVTKKIIHLGLFLFIYFSYFGTYEDIGSIRVELLVFLKLSSLLILFKIVMLYLLRGRKVVGTDYKNIIILGYNDDLNSITKYFKAKKKSGYNYIGFFTNKTVSSNDCLGELSGFYKYIENNKNIDEVYCSLSELSDAELKEIKNFADNNMLAVKLIPSSGYALANNTKIDYYDISPVISTRRLPLENLDMRILKRVFDLVFSFLVIILIFSWLFPIIAILIKIDSKGPVFFKQKRPGIGGDFFNCLKFRSMRTDADSQLAASRVDNRITKLGKFLRKSSIDELPQFLNVFAGNMSIIGPRPHNKSMSSDFAKTVNKFMIRHYVKPGITGLAQVRGLRGEIEKHTDIEHRVKLDIFYIENWSFLLDIKIIIKTVLNVIKGEDKAY